MRTLDYDDRYEGWVQFKLVAAKSLVIMKAEGLGSLLFWSWRLSVMVVFNVGLC